MDDPKNQMVKRCCFRICTEAIPGFVERRSPFADVLVQTTSRGTYDLRTLRQRKILPISLPYTFCIIDPLNPSLHSGFTPPCQRSSLAICADNFVSTKSSTSFLTLIRSLHFCTRLCFNEMPSRLLYCNTTFPSFPFTCPEPKL